MRLPLTIKRWRCLNYRPASQDRARIVFGCPTANYAASINQVIMIPTILILGAGSSAPYKFPLASELKQQICDAFNQGLPGC